MQLNKKKIPHIMLYDTTTKEVRVLKNWEVNNNTSKTDTDSTKATSKRGCKKGRKEKQGKKDSQYATINEKTGSAGWIIKSTPYLKI